MAMKAGCLQPGISPFRSRRRKSRLGPPTDSMSIISCGQVTLMHCFHLRSRQCSTTAPSIEGEAGRAPARRAPARFWRAPTCTTSTSGDVAPMMIGSKSLTGFFAGLPLRRAADKQRQADRCCNPSAHVWSSISGIVSCSNVDTVVLGGKRGTERLAARGEVRKHLGLVRRPSEYGFMAGIVADEAAIIRAAPCVLERHFGHHSDPVLVSAPEVASLEAKIAKTVIDWPPLIELDRQRIVWAVTHDDIGAGVDGCAADLGHIL